VYANGTEVRELQFSSVSHAVNRARTLPVDFAGFSSPPSNDDVISDSAATVRLSDGLNVVDIRDDFFSSSLSSAVAAGETVASTMPGYDVLLPVSAAALVDKLPGGAGDVIVSVVGVLSLADISSALTGDVVDALSVLVTSSVIVALVVVRPFSPVSATVIVVVVIKAEVIVSAVDYRP